VDDNLDYVQSMALLLRAFGHQVDFASNGFAALSEARRLRPEIVFLDVGSSAAEVARSSAGYP
jgi:two-component system, sensor histidine kinase